MNSRSFTCVCALLLLSSPAIDADDRSVSPRFPAEKISLEQWRIYKSEVEAIPDVKCEDRERGQYLCDSTAQRTIWVFTRPGHPAHPAVSRGVLILRYEAGNTTVGIDRSGHYVSNQAAYKEWIREFAILDKRQVNQWEEVIEAK